MSDWISIFINAVLFMAIGFLWYSPMVFGKQWMKYLGMKNKKAAGKNMGSAYLTLFVIALVMLFALNRFIFLTNSTNAVSGALVGFWIWLGFIATYAVNGVVFEKRPLGLYWINVGYYFVALIITGALMGMWK